MMIKVQMPILISIFFIIVSSNRIFAQSNLCEPYKFKTVAASHYCNLNGSLIFLSDGLWKTDGTVSGTIKVSSVPGSMQGPFAVIGNTAYFKSQLQIWKTDGTEAGTVKVAEVSDATSIGELVPSGNNIFFLVRQKNSIINKLWKTDGTAAGTALVKDIDPSSSSSWDPRHLFAFNNEVFFKAGNSAFGTELWKSDGTSGGTIVVKDVNPGSGNGTSWLGPYYAIYKNELYYYGGYATSGANSFGLWKTNGTDQGTSLVKATGSVDNPKVINGILYFFAYDEGASIGDSQHGSELWRSDGTAAGTFMVKDINPGKGTGVSTGSQLAAINDKVVFAAGSSTATGIELWATDGTSGGTTLLKDIFPGSKSSLGNYFTASDPVNGRIYFGADDGSIGRELWATDGTSAGTTLVSDLWQGSEGSGPWKYYTFNGNLYFNAELSSFNDNLWSCGNLVGVMELQNNPAVSLYPNPAGDLLSIELPEYANTVAELFSIEGKLLKRIQVESSSTTVKIDQLDPGIYFVKVINSNGASINKFIKI